MSEGTVEGPGGMWGGIGDPRFLDRPLRLRREHPDQFVSEVDLLLVHPEESFEFRPLKDEGVPDLQETVDDVRHFVTSISSAADSLVLKNPSNSGSSFMRSRA